MNNWKKDHNREEEKNESIYTKEIIEENIENQFKNNFKVKEDDKSNLAFIMQKIKNIKKLKQKSMNLDIW